MRLFLLYVLSCAVVFVFFIFAFEVGIKFVYMNIVLPAPYKEDLRACLETARQKTGVRAAERARNVCFRTYPHFL